MSCSSSTKLSKQKFLGALIHPLVHLGLFYISPSYCFKAPSSDIFVSLTDNGSEADDQSRSGVLVYGAQRCRQQKAECTCECNTSPLNTSANSVFILSFHNDFSQYYIHHHYCVFANTTTPLTLLRWLALGRRRKTMETTRPHCQRVKTVQTSVPRMERCPSSPSCQPHLSSPEPS